MLGDPGILLFDEPVNGLDPEGIRWLRSFLRELASEGRTILLSSHLMNEVEETVDHVVVIARGQLIADASIAEFTQRSTRSHAWEFRFAPLVAERLRARRRGRRSASWYLEETYVKVAGRWCYLYRAIDREGDLFNSMLSEHCDKHAERRSLRRLTRPRSVTTDQHPAYRRAIWWLVGRRAKHRTTQYLNNSPNRVIEA